MPAKKKKGRGKARKAARKADEQQRLLDTQMERMKIGGDSQTNADEDALLEEAIKLVAAEKEEQMAIACSHGHYVEIGEEYNIIEMFTETFLSEAFARDDGKVNLSGALATVKGKYPIVWYDLSKLKLVVSFLLCNATDHVLEGDIDSARHFAQFVPYFEAFVSAKQTGEIVEQSWAAILDLCNCDDEHTLVKYLRKRIPCTCLDEKYEEVKSKSRMGVCFNCKSAVERSKVLTCSQCGTVNYCGRKCQKAHWHGHKEMCAKITCSKMTLNVMDQL